MTLSEDVLVWLGEIVDLELTAEELAAYEDGSLYEDSFDSQTAARGLKRANGSFFSYCNHMRLAVIRYSDRREVYRARERDHTSR